MAETTTRDCQNQVADKQKETTVFFCLVMKEYLPDCPEKCSYFFKGAPIQMDALYQLNFKLECPFLHLITNNTSPDEHYFICGKTGETPKPQEYP
ncbi:MAG: hypothetical protein JSW11_05225 [Candidatus Heimdallarchaeota archaeon]|nr:MAG: hypothetical protein JSW11_05225 [Candidatus Heimdallarchaeota archaeon]